MWRFWTRQSTAAMAKSHFCQWSFSNLVASVSRPDLFGGMITRSMTKSILKTNKAAAKRFRVKGNGELKRSQGGRSHNTGYKSRARKNRLAKSTGVKGTGIEKRMKQLIGA